MDTQVTFAPWWLLVVSLPTQGSTARMRLWRALKARGCQALRDGAYLLPTGSEHEEALQALADECRREGGSAWLLQTRPRSESEEQGWRALFDRRSDYASLRQSWKQARRELKSISANDLARLQRRFRREYEALRSVDFFPGPASAEAEAAWHELDKHISRQLSPDEPQAHEGKVPRLDAAKYQGRTWATRHRLWVDRVASAWLIRRFIDPKARFRWLARPSDCPRSALGFDFDGAAFSHVGDLVTFEMLLASFGLDGDPALRRLAALVHQLDVGGEPVPEASGFEAVLSGARERLGGDDDALLAEMSLVLDSLYAHFLHHPGREK